MAKGKGTAAGGMDPGATLAVIQNAGIVGMGGGGFPAHAKYRAEVDTVLANGAECEPLLWSDKQLMLQWPEELIDGVAAMVELTGAARGIIAYKGKYKAVGATLEAALRARGDSGPRIELAKLPNIYPAGDEFTLLQLVLDRTISEGGLPLHVGAVVNNVATFQGIARALRSGEPLTRRLISVVGEVREPQVLDAPVGTPYADLIEAAGGLTRSDVALVDGGPMMGTLVEPGDPMGKASSGLLVLPESHPIIQRKLLDPVVMLRQTRAVCCLCSQCTDVCPRNALGHRLTPHRLMQSVAAGITFDDQAYLGALLCCECGLCTVFGCPLYLDPARMNIEIKKLIRARKQHLPDPQQTEPTVSFDVKQVPLPRLIARLGVSRYLKELPLGRFPVDPEAVQLRFRQGVGQHSVAVVSEGDELRVGQLVAKPGGPMSAALHASIDGVVTQVDEQAVTLRRKS